MSCPESGYGKRECGSIRTTELHGSYCHCRERGPKADPTRDIPLTNQLSKLRPIRSQHQPTVLHALRADQRIGDLLHRPRLTLYYQHFEAVIVIEVHMQGGKNVRVMVVLQVRELLIQHADVVIIDQR